MKTTIAVLLALFLWSIPGSAYACSGWIDCWLGISSTVEIRQTEQTERERIAADRDADIARIEAEAAERIQQAQNQVEQMRFENETDRVQALAKVEEYKAMIAGLTSEKIAGIQSNADSQIAALQAQAEIAIAGITETGATERYRVAGGWLFAVVAVVVAGLILLAIIRRQPQQTVVLLADPGQYRQLENQTKVIEVQHAKRYLSKN